MFFCEVCDKAFEPKPEDTELLEQLFGVRSAECPQCGSFTTKLVPVRSEQHQFPHDVRAQGRWLAQVPRGWMAI